jgi:hypothetical protein
MGRIRACQDSPHAARTMAVTIFSGIETSIFGPNLIRQSEQVLSNGFFGREGKKMEAYKKMAWIWAVLLVYAVGYTIGASVCIV